MRKEERQRRRWIAAESLDRRGGGNWTDRYEQCDLGFRVLFKVTFPDIPKNKKSEEKNPFFSQEENTKRSLITQTYFAKKSIEKLSRAFFLKYAYTSRFCIPRTKDKTQECALA